MDTYGDMVTLMLCFFVMLYSMSTVDQQKWQQLVESLNPTSEATGDAADEIVSAALGQAVTQEDVNQDLEELYLAIQQYVDQTGMSNRVSVGQGSGYVFISFDDTIFFSGDSYTLLDEGRAVLDQVAGTIASVSDSIDEIRVLGHTAQANPDSPNDPSVDRFLSSNRATVVTVYLQEKNIIDPARLVSVGYGQWRPVASNDTTEGRAENRRVELIITGLHIDEENSDDITQYYTMRGGTQGTASSGGGDAGAASGAEPE